jgi:hypothetical protein
MGPQESFRGTATATGVVTMNPDQDFTRGKRSWSAWLGVTGYKHIALQVEGLDGAIELQGNNGDPEEASEWYTIAQLTTDGRTVVSDDPIAFVRVNVTTLTSGTPSVLLMLES